MARLPRFVAPGMPQHVIQRGNNRTAIFADRSDYRFFRTCLREACREHRCEVHAYVFMTNHIHLLMTPTSDSGIADVMQSVGRRYVRRFNDRYDRTGTLWEGRYRATLVDTRHYLLACQRYIELNPVRAGLSADPGDYPWSSYRASAFGAVDSLVSFHGCYLAIGRKPRDRQIGYRAMCRDGLPETMLDEIRDATQRRWALGSKRFRDEVSELLARQAQPQRKAKDLR